MRPRICSHSLIYSLIVIFTPTAARAADKPISFINDIAPIFKENCLACHDAKKRAGKYDMTTFEKLMAGGANGEPIVPTKPADSDLHDLMITTEARRMPPRDKGDAVPKEKAALVARWIQEGAKLDPGIDPKADLGKELRIRWQPPAPPSAYAFPAVVTALAFSPDSKQIIAGGHHELTVWEIPSGKLVKRIRTRAERSYGFAFLEKGKLAVAGGRPGQEGDVRIYDLDAEGTIENGIMRLDGVGDKSVLLASIFDTDDSILAIASSPDGKKLAAGGCDRSVRVWDLSGGLDKVKLEQVVDNHADWVLAISFTTDGKYLATASRDKTAKVWDLAAKESLVTFPEHQFPVYGVAVKGDSTMIYSTGEDKQVRSWKLNGEGKQLKNQGGHSDAIFKIIPNPRQPMLATVSADKTLRLWNSDSLQATKTLSGFTDYVYAVAFSHDGEFVAGGSYAGEVRIWKVSDGAAVASFNASPGWKPGK